MRKGTNGDFYMAANAFDRCHEVTAKWEGGWSNHKADPGGATMYGVTQAVYDSYRVARNKAKRSVRFIALEEALTIYKVNYWASAGCERLHAGVDLAHYDCAVNSGVGRARKLLAASIGDAPHITVKKYCAKRLGFVQGLRTWKTFGRGWSRRIADIEAKGVSWALAAYGDSKTQNQFNKQVMEREAAKAGTKSDAQKAGGAGAAGTTVAGGGATAVAPDQLASSTVLALLAVGVALAFFLIWRANVNKDRAEAYAAEAAK